MPHFKEPDGQFATIIAAWARGASLATVLDLADAEIGQTSPGDFVRNAKQVADLCEQLARLQRPHVRSPRWPGRLVTRSCAVSWRVLPASTRSR